MVYGALAIPLQRLMPWEVAVAAAIGLCAVLHGLVRVKNRWMSARPLPPRFQVLAPILK
jgi:hypothetical protein